MNPWIIVLIFWWLLCGYVGAGFMTAYWARAYPMLPWHRDRVMELTFGAVLGPIALLVTVLWICVCSFHGYQGWMNPFAGSDQSRSAR